MLKLSEYLYYCLDTIMLLSPHDTSPAHTTSYSTRQKRLIAKAAEVETGAKMADKRSEKRKFSEAFTVMTNT